jgi:lysyl endopeptidase
MKLNLLFVFLLFITLSFAQQIPDDIKPPSWFLETLNVIKPYKLASFDVKALMDEDIVNDKDKSKPWRFGHEIYVDHSANDVGEWTTLPNGDRIWRMTYKSEGAHTLNFMFDIFWIPEGATLYVYSNDKNDLIRPFTHHNNNPEEVLGTWLVKGDQAWIEYYQPAGVLGDPKLTVGAVVHGYRTAETFQKALNDSGDCNHDVDCDITAGSDPYQLNTRKEELKKSGALILRGGTEWCSGTLINNTNNDGTPYFLTANHCGGSEGTWAFRFNWRSPNPSCGTTANSPNGSFNQTVSGAIRRASSDRSDLKLVEISDASFFNNNPDVIWSGWNRSTTQVPNANFGIHHPAGDIQKVCRDDGGAFRYSDGGQDFWRINDWDLGVTEGGSSGSGLFNENGHLIGMLTAGTAACNGTNDNGGFDIYGRFGVAWDFGSTAASRLSDWLDPGNTGVTTIDVFPSLEIFDIDVSVSAGSNNDRFICNEDFSPQVTLINRGTFTLTSANVSYSLDTAPETVINWTGSLSMGDEIVLAVPVYSNLSPGSHTFTVSAVNPNGTTDENTGNDAVAFNFEIAPEFLTNTIVFNILTDNYGSETTWQLINSTGAIVSNGPATAYTNAVTFQEVITIPVLNECYTFTIFDSQNDGICCGFGSGNYNLQDDSGNFIINSTGNFDSSEAVTFNIQDPLSVDEFGLDRLVRLYPNPVDDILNVALTSTNEDLSYSIYNTLGQQVSKGNLKANRTQSINMSHQESGIYFIKLSTPTHRMVRKIIKN